MSAEPLLQQTGSTDAPSLMRRLSRKPGAFTALLFLIGLYALLPFAEIIAPHAPETRNNDVIYMPPTPIHLFHEGKFIGPFVYGTKSDVNVETFQRVFTQDKSQPLPLRFFCSGDRYEFWGLFPPPFISSARRRMVTCSCSALTGWGGMFSAAPCTARASRLPSA
jgi:hypothetical protein